MNGLPSGPWEGRAVLCFRRSGWFEDPAGVLVGLVAGGLGPTPGALVLDGPLPTVRPGARLAFVEGTWVLEGVGPLPVGPSKGTTWAPGPLPKVDPGWRGRWSDWFGQTLPRDTEGLWLQSLLLGPPDPWESLVGRGSGSTPSGDDVLAGWLAVQRRRGRFGTEDRHRLLAALPRTTRLSRHYLGHLAEGRIDPSLAGFLGGAVAPEPGSVAAQAVAGHGDLSGPSTLVGLVAGLTQE
jgi:hypothetical protein